MPVVHFKQRVGDGGNNRLGTLCNAPKTGTLITGDRIMSGYEKGHPQKPFRNRSVFNYLFSYCLTFVFPL